MLADCMSCRWLTQTKTSTNRAALKAHRENQQQQQMTTMQQQQGTGGAAGQKLPPNGGAGALQRGGTATMGTPRPGSPASSGIDAQVPPTAFASNAIVPVADGGAPAVATLDVKPPANKIW